MSTQTSKAKARKKTAPDQLDKLEKQAIAEELRNIKPGECHKLVRALIDPQCVNGGHGAEILKKLAEINIKFDVQSQPVDGLIRFQTTIRQPKLVPDEGTGVVATDGFAIANKLLYVMLGDQFVKTVNEGKLVKRIENIQNKCPDNTVVLLIYGMKNYCRQNRGCVGIRETETALAEIQLFNNCGHKHHDTPEELATTIAQYAKAIAEIPFKKHHSELHNQEQVYLGNEKKDCIRIEDSGLGLSRLWQQQLLKMPLITLEVAEAIIKEYPMPKTLIDAYHSSCGNGAHLLSNIPVRRHAGVLQTARKIGPEMSRKVYEFFSSTDPQKIIQ